jgi:Lon protease-like protein
MTELPMFPLGSVLLPHMPLQLRVFEQRYLTMLTDMLEAESSEFGVVLIERGQEVGGGEHRFPFGTVAEITELGTGDGVLAVAASGGTRFEVTEWLDEAAYPQAVVREIDELEWDESLRPLREQAEGVVRRALAIASEFTEQRWASVVELSEDPVKAAWQLAGICPVGELDQLRFLRAGTMLELLTLVHEAGLSASQEYGAPWGQPEEDTAF